ncbi:Cell division control protein 6-like protein [Camponotus floridanus]|uniref:Cell division control protein n=1 Tax=Camponotus floridanus TaxID=104421 RepID=E2ABV9_CAMFO|nr:cell division control protein 6 homolog [Camponotus floridanus]EFN69054.1 Cell division control protein 6-like protein [Camponotus floridanus]
MSTTQTSISFPIRKKCSFYGRKDDVAKEDFTNATARYTPCKYTPTVKKIVTLTSSESESESESDIENSRTEEQHRIIDDRRPSSLDNTPRSRRRKCSGEVDEQLSPSPHKQRRNRSQEGDKLQGKDKSSLTPSTLLNKLELSTAKENRLNPKQLFKSHSKEEKDELNCNSLLFNSLFGLNKYQNARKALHSSETEELPGREKELAKLQEFFQRHLERGTSGSLYVSGPPGTGKTASLFKIMRQSDLKSKLKIVYINCTSMKSAAAIYAKIIQELAITSATKSGKNGKAIIERYLTSKKSMLLLVLDEIDQLESKKQSVLYSIFEWPSISNSKLILIGIANALDLTDRILPRLQARCELKPMLMHFAPYTKQQISDIISSRLNQVNANGVFTSSAIQLLAGKVAAISGDIRRALDISRRVVELAESHQVAQVLRPTNDNDTNIEPLKQEMEVTEKPVDLKEVVTILNGVYGGTQNIDQEQETFPLQQKLLLCSLLLILNKGRNKDVTVGKLHEVYKKVCKKRNIFAVDDSEFVNLCSLIETRGILRVVGRKEARLCKVNLQWDQEELDAALQDKQMMAEIINDISCL